MTALADALAAAQRRALTAIEKGYVAGALTREQVVEIMEGIGATDGVDRDRLLASLDTIRSLGAQLPSEPTNGVQEKKPEPASQAQLDLIQRLIGEKGAQHPDLPLNKQEAHEIIDTLKAGTYDYAKWHVAF